MRAAARAGRRPGSAAPGRQDRRQTGREASPSVYEAPCAGESQSRQPWYFFLPKPRPAGAASVGCRSVSLPATLSRSSHIEQLARGGHNGGGASGAARSRVPPAVTRAAPRTSRGAALSRGLSSGYEPFAMDAAFCMKLRSTSLPTSTSLTLGCFAAISGMADWNCLGSGYGTLGTSSSATQW